MIDIRKNAKGQEYEANTTVIIITIKIENKIAGSSLDSRGMLATMYLNDRYKEKRKGTGI